MMRGFLLVPSSRRRLPLPGHLFPLLLLGASPALAGPCAVLSVDSPVISSCNGAIRFALADPDANLDPATAETVLIQVRSAAEPLGEPFPLVETGPDSGEFAGWVPVSSQFDLPGIVFFQPGTASTLRGSYVDPDCDLDGDGQIGEDDFTDVDGDGVLDRGPNGAADSPYDDAFDDDNCYDGATGLAVSNPGQEDSDTFCVDDAGATDGTFCTSVGDCSAPFDAACRGDRVGDVCDNCPDDFNPDQADDDLDGVGDVCELDYRPGLGFRDQDVDGVANGIDNCPTIFNPSQADTGNPGTPFDGRGNACDGGGDREQFYGIVILAGPDGSIDSTPAVDDIRVSASPVIWAGQNGVANTSASGDDLLAVSVGTIFDCNPTTPGTPDGDGVPDGVDTCVADCDPLQVDTDGDGIGDLCEVAEDWDFDLTPDVLDVCPTVFDPSQDDADGDGLGDACDPDSDDDDRDGQPDDLVQVAVAADCDLLPAPVEVVDWQVTDFGLGDGDGVPDPGEILTLDLTLRNRTAELPGGGVDLTNVIASIAATSDAVDCMLDATVLLGSLPAGETRSNPLTDRFQLLVATNPSTQTTSLAQIRTTDLAVVITADELPGVTGGATFRMPLDLDVLGDLTGGGPLGGTGELSEGFEGLSGTADLVDTLGRSGATLADVIPFLPGATCSINSTGAADCSLNNANLDWHLHDPTAEPANAPGGTAYTTAHTGNASLHLARHTHPTDPERTTYRFRQLSAFVGPPMNLTLFEDAILEFWHIAMMADDNSIGFRIGEAGDYGALQVRLDTDSDPAVDAFGPWEILHATINPYEHTRDSIFNSSCKFDPLDDHYDASQGGVANETMCPPQGGYSQVGSRTGSDWLNCTDSDHNGERDCGDTRDSGPPYTAPGVGPGVWVYSRFDLLPYQGRRIQVRWIFSSLAFGEPTFLSYLETPLNPGAYDINENDDGWWIDDILFTGLLEQELQLTPDGGDDIPAGSALLCGPDLIAGTRAEKDDVQVLPVGSFCTFATDPVVTAGGNGLLDSVAMNECPTESSAFCLGAVARINGLRDAALASGGPSEPVLLDGHGSTLSPCAGGVPLYEFARCDDLDPLLPCDDPTILLGFSPTGLLTVSPAENTRYRLRVRCSSQLGGTGCEDETRASVFICPSSVDDGLVLDAASITCDVESAGSLTTCEPADPLAVSFVKPAQAAGFDGFSLHRLAASQLGPGALEGADCVVPLFGDGVPAGQPVGTVESPAFDPGPGGIAFYLVVPEPAPACGLSPAGLSRPTVTGTGINGPQANRLLASTCP